MGSCQTASWRWIKLSDQSIYTIYAYAKHDLEFGQYMIQYEQKDERWPQNAAHAQSFANITQTCICEITHTLIFKVNSE